MPKLHLKRTPAEEEERARKKARRAEKKARRRDNDYNHDRHADRSRSPRRHRCYDQDLSEGEAGPSRPRHRDDSPYDSEAQRARAEQEEFDAKMRDALEDDAMFDHKQRLDGVEARLNSYAHIPRRWRGTNEGFGAGLWMEDALDEIGLQPWQMNDDEYAEYIRAGMWRKKNQAEYQERLRKKEEREARRARQEKLREETRRLHDESRAHRAEKDAEKAKDDKKKLIRSRRAYDERWSRLLERTPEGEEAIRLRFEDIPWPISTKATSIALEAFTKDSISHFLLSISLDDGTLPKDIVRRSLLRFHPDKFESQVLARVMAEDLDRTRQAADAVVKILNDIAKEHR